PTRTAQRGQANIAGDTGNVSVQWNHELTRNHPGPHTAIDAVLRPDHPSQIEVHALTRAPFRRTRELKPHSDSPLQFTARIELFVPETEQCRAEVFQSRSDVRVLGRERRGERR